MIENEQVPEAAQAPRPISRAAILGALLIGAVVGGMAVEYWVVTRGVATPAAQTAAPADAADLAYLKSIVPTQSHTMKDVEDHWTNLWFAAEKRNWVLARFFFDQARQSIRWTTTIRPTRQLATGGSVDVKGMFTALDMSAFATVQIAIEDQDVAAFEAAYRQTLDGCVSCHTAVGMPFLRPTVPTSQASTILDFSPQAAPTK